MFGSGTRNQRLEALLPESIALSPVRRVPDRALYVVGFGVSVVPSRNIRDQPKVAGIAGAASESCFRLKVCNPVRFNTARRAAYPDHGKGTRPIRV
jgi:hypothetical protein